MNRKTIKLVISSLMMICCFLTIPKPAIASNNYYSLDNSGSFSFYAHKNKENKHQGCDIFNEENHKYLSSAQKKKLQELKKCKDKGDAFSEDQQKELHSIIDSIIKGKLGDKKYQDFKTLVEKKRSNEELTEEENEKLNEYRSIIDGSKPTTEDILNQFIR